MPDSIGRGGRGDGAHRRDAGGERERTFTCAALQLLARAVYG
ncbi:hypothetical protein [Dactylosporangium sp. NPDC050588]